jgi:hypothetical protein
MMIVIILLDKFLYSYDLNFFVTFENGKTKVEVATERNVQKILIPALMLEITLRARCDLFVVLLGCMRVVTGLHFILYPCFRFLN